MVGVISHVWTLTPPPGVLGITRIHCHSTHLGSGAILVPVVQLDLETIAVEARQLVDGASFGPEALKVIGQAFDAAWVQIAGYFGNDPIDIKKGRIRLAHAVLSVADDDSRDVAVVRQAALERMALDYKRRTDPI